MIERPSGDFIQWLRAFYYVATCGGVSSAAVRMGLRQPAVSHLVRALENDLGVRLFLRGPRSMTLTLEGEQLMERCLTLFELIREIKAEVGEAVSELLKGEIRVVTSHSVSQNYLPSRLEGFVRRNKEVRFQVTGVAEMSMILGYVLGAEYDMGIVTSEVIPPSLVSRPLFASRLVLAVPKEVARERGWQFSCDAQGWFTDLRQLEGVPFIRFTPTTIMGSLIDRELARQQVTPRPVATVNTSTLLKRYMETGLGVTIIDEFSLAEDVECFHRYPLLGNEALRTYYLITRAKRYLPPQARAFMQYLLTEECRVAGRVFNSHAH